MAALKQRLPLLFFVFALALAAFIRFWAAPLSAGPDVSQFWAFAEVFRLHGLDFYRFAKADTDFFPFTLWSYVYPPLWLLILGLALLAAPHSLASNVMADPAWRIAMKTPIILADLAIGVLLYWGIPGGKYKKLLFACLWLFNPTAWYNSAVFGQFDAIAAAFLLASVIMLERGKDRLAFLFAALAVLTKQTALLAVAMMLAVCLRAMNWRRLARNVAIMAGVVAVFSLPFLFTGNFLSYAQALFFPAQAPDYQFPLYLSFSGSGSLLTYLHNTFGWETAKFLHYNTIVLAAALVAALVLAWLKRISVVRGALIGVLLFIALFYRVNYQYLLMFIPIALLVAAKTPYRSERILALALALLPAVWVWLFRVSAWFYNLQPFGMRAVPLLTKLGLSHELPDKVFVLFAVVLMALCLAYVILAFVRWQKPLAAMTIARPVSGGTVRDNAQAGTPV